MCSTCGCGKKPATRQLTTIATTVRARSRPRSRPRRGLPVRAVRVETALLCAKTRNSPHTTVGSSTPGASAGFNFISAPGVRKDHPARTARSRCCSAQEFAALSSRGEPDHRQRPRGASRGTRRPRLHQIQTGKGVHLDAHQVGHALEHLAPEEGALLFVRERGQPDLPDRVQTSAEHERVVMLSVTEGDGQAPPSTRSPSGRPRPW